MKKVLVTGVNGFIGNSLCESLLAQDYIIVAPCRKPSELKSHDRLQPVNIPELQADIDWKPMLAEVETIVHLAARVHVMNEVSRNPLDEFRNVNLNATLNLAKQASQAGVKRFIYISSIKVNGEGTLPGKPFTASDDSAPTDPYAVSKYEAEVALHKLAQKTDLEVVIIRPPLVYGPGVKANFLIMMQLLKRGLPLPLGAINNARSLVALDNLVDFIILCVNHPKAANQTFLVSDGEDLSTTELLKRLANVLGVSAHLLPVPTVILKIGANLIGKSVIAHRLCGSLQVDINKNRELLGWTPPYSVDKELQKVANHFLKQSLN